MRSLRPCIFGFAAAIVLTALGGPARADSTAVFKFQDGTGLGFAARLVPIEPTCPAPAANAEDEASEELELQIGVSKPIEEEPIEEMEMPKGARPWPIGELVRQLLLQSRGFGFKIGPDGNAALWKQGRPNQTAELTLTQGPDWSESPVVVTGYFYRTDLRIGKEYDPDDPLSLADRVDVTLRFDCR